MSDQSRPIPVANSDVGEIVQVFQPDTDGAANNPSSKAASASSAPAKSLQHSAASQQDAFNSQASVSTEKIGEAYKAEGTLGVRILVQSF